MEKAHVVIYGIGNTGSLFQTFGLNTDPDASLVTYVKNEYGEWEYDSSEDFPLSDIIETYDYSAPGSIMPFGSNSGTDIVKLYYHHDRLGSTDYLTNNVDGRIMSYISRDDWGQPDVKKMVLNTGTRELGDLVLQYTVHPYDLVLGAYFAQARLYDAADRRFMAMDTVKGLVTNPATLAQYAYVLNNPLIWVDEDGNVPNRLLRMSDSGSGNKSPSIEKQIKPTVVPAPAPYSGNSFNNFVVKPNNNPPKPVAPAPATPAPTVPTLYSGYSANNLKIKSNTQPSYVAPTPPPPATTASPPIRLKRYNTSRYSNKFGCDKKLRGKYSPYNGFNAIMESSRKPYPYWEHFVAILQGREDEWYSENYERCMEAVEAGLNARGAIHGLASIYSFAQLAQMQSGTATTSTSGNSYGDLKAAGGTGNRTFTSSDKYVGETANAIEARSPNSVVGVNRIVKDSTGRIITDYDIELNNYVIQVKSGSAKGLTTQMINTAASTDKTVIGYTPNLNPSSAVVKGVQNAGFNIFTNLDDLLNFIGK